MSVEEQREEVGRILGAPQFRRAPKLRQFLELICELHFAGRSAEINEYLIATQAFGKGAEFDPGEDSLVRVQARELRRRLREYYENEGKSSRWLVDIPTGQYAPSFIPAKAEVEAADPGRKPATLRATWLILAGTVATCAVLLIAADHERRLLVRSTAMALNLRTPSPTPAIGALWSRFFNSDVPTLLVMSSPEVDECGGKGPATGCAEEQYTGMGEAVAVHLITSLFRSSKQTLIAKPSRIVTADDVKRYNLVLLGGKSVNVWTLRLGGDLSLEERDAPPGFETVLDRRTGQVTRDRGIVALRRHAASGRWVLFIWGHHSQGTHAAAEACTDERFLAQLKWPGSPFPDGFHVLMNVEVSDGVPGRAVPLAVRVP